jgi:hypothetical protein
MLPTGRRMTDRFDSTKTDHLTELLSRAADFVDGESPSDRRLAAMCLFDYYQAILRKTGRMVGRDFGGDSIPAIYGKLTSDIGEVGLAHLDGLGDLRDKVYHREDFAPDQRVLRAFLGRALSDHQTLISAARNAGNKEATAARTRALLDASFVIG